MTNPNQASSYGVGDVATEELAQVVGQINLVGEPVASSSANIAKEVVAANDESSTVPDFRSISIFSRCREMEDTLTTEINLCEPAISGFRPIHFFAVFDGYFGSKVANMCKDQMHHCLGEALLRDGLLNKALAPTQARWTSIFEETFAKMDEGVLDALEVHDKMGSTAVVALVTPDQVIVANCGDSSVVLGRGGEVIPLSNGHVPTRPDECERIVANKGRVVYNNGAYTVMGEVHVTRSLGIPYLKPMVSSQPEMTITDRTYKEEFLIVGCDGFWNQVSPETACAVVRRCLYGEGVCLLKRDGTAQSRCEKALAMLLNAGLANTRPCNITIIVVDLKK